MIVTDNLKYLPTHLKSSKSIRWKQCHKQQALEVMQKVTGVFVSDPVVFTELVGAGYITRTDMIECRRLNFLVPPRTPSDTNMRALFIKRELVEAEDNREKLKQPTLKLEVFLVSSIKP